MFTTLDAQFDGETLTDADLFDHLLGAGKCTVVAKDFAPGTDLLSCAVSVHYLADDNGRVLYAVTDNNDGAEVLDSAAAAWETAVEFASNVDTGGEWFVAYDGRIPAVAHGPRPPLR